MEKFRRTIKILITGGFAGSNIFDSLVNEDYEVIVRDDLSRGKETNINPKAKFNKLDMQSPKLETVVHKEKPDYINHHAAQIDVRHSVYDQIFDANINILYTINILRNCVNYKVERVILASSGGDIYGEQTILPAPETQPLKPVSPYGIATIIAGNYLH